MTAKDTSFDLFLQSNASMDTFPSNTISSFTNKFGVNIKLQGEWGVALRTIGYQKTWLNVTKREGVRITIAVHVVRKNSRKIQEITRQVPEGSYASPTAFITMLYSITKTLYTTSGLAGEDNVRVVYGLEDVLDIAYQQETNQFTFEIITNTFKQIKITIEGGAAGLQLRKVIGVGPMCDDVPATIVIRRGRRFTAPLRADFYDKVSNLWIYAPGLVEMSQLGDGVKPLLAPIPAQQGVQGEYVHYTVDSPMYLRVTANIITAISIDVFDYFNQRIAFDDNSAPFILSLHFSRTDTLHALHNSAIPWGLSDSEAYVYAFSNKSTDRYTNNTPTDFYNHLAKPMNLSGKWMVALCELRYQKSWVQLYRSQEVDVHLECVKYCAPKKISVKFPRGNYFTPHDLIRIWNSTWVTLAKRKPGAAASPPTPPPRPPTSNFNIDHIKRGGDDDSDDDDDDDAGESYRPPWYRRTDPPEISIRLGKLVRLMYSPANRRFVFSIVRNRRVQVERATIDFSPSINHEVHPSDEQHRRDDLIYLFGVQLYGTNDDRHTELIKLNVFDPPHLLAAAPDFQDQTYNLWVTAPGLVCMTHIAESLQPLLNIVPVKGRTNDYLHHIYKERHYVQVEAGDCNDVHIRIVDGVHEVVELKSTKPTIAVLHFKRVLVDV